MSSPIDIVYFSNYSGNTKKFVERLDGGRTHIRIPIDWNSNTAIVVSRPFVLFVPTYGGGSERTAVPRQVRHFLNVRENRDLLAGIVGFGNTNFGEHFCKAAEVISRKTNKPIIGRVEIFGTPEDVETIRQRMELLYGYE